MAAKKGKGLTIGILLGKGKPKDEPDGDESMGDTMDDGSEESDEELPPGLLEAVTEFRSSESDEDAAKAFHRAMQCCEEM